MPRFSEPVLLVDLDGTVVCVNTFPRFVRLQLGEAVRRRHPRLVIRLLWGLGRRRFGVASHGELKQIVIEGADVVSAGRMAVWADELIKEEGVDAVLKFIGEWEGAKILCTAAPQAYASAFARSLSMDLAFGSVVRNGALFDNSGMNKRLSLKYAGIISADSAITDDPDLDRPLLELASHGWIVIDGVIHPAVPGTPTCGAETASPNPES